MAFQFKPSDIIALFNIIAPAAFQLIRDARDKNPGLTYKQSLELAGVKLDAEYEQLLADMAKAVSEGAVPRTPPA